MAIVIRTTYKASGNSGKGQIVARSGNRQKTVAYNHERSAHWNHGEAAALLGFRVLPSGKLDEAARKSRHEHVGNGKHKFTFDV